MIEQHPFAAFLDLITLDQKIYTIQKDIIGMRDRLNILSAQQDTLTQGVADIQSNINALRVQIGLQEKEMYDLDQEEKAKKNLLTTLTDYREIKALQAEIDTLRRSQLEYEQLIIHSWNKLEQVQKELSQAESLRLQSVKTLQEEIALIEADILKQTHILNEFLQERPEKVAAIPSEWMDHYTIMASRVSDPVVAVEQESCSACFSSIAKQDMLRLQKKALLKCKTCFRLLYHPLVMQKDV